MREPSDAFGLHTGGGVGGAALIEVSAVAAGFAAHAGLDATASCGTSVRSAARHLGGAGRRAGLRLGAADDRLW
ncbi:hypothetical protein ABZ801_02090 [Actinomadura sp. NPDC047616]|uniref:hypothetical protein n=1 Tax=Actinomadura sp. NPDC047616 TaxID=3155914 RepID=UPI0033F26102